MSKDQDMIVVFYDNVDEGQLPLITFFSPPHTELQMHHNHVNVTRRQMNECLTIDFGASGCAWIVPGTITDADYQR
jgi:hypothetical protein